MLNSVMLIGKVEGDLSPHEAPDGTSGCLFTVRVMRKAHPGEDPPVRGGDLFTVVAWRRLAEICSRYLKPGREIFVAGRIEQAHKTIIVARTLQFLQGGRP